MPSPLRWGAYLLPDGSVVDSPPACECCNGNGAGCCPICNFTGHAPAWHIQPAAAMEAIK